jgi:CHAT domain-containing protein/predicted negative regulator of RcsB-dependent stress response
MLKATITALLLASAPQVYEPLPPARLTAHPAEEYSPAVSPNAKLMAFVSNQAGPPNIWIKTLAGPEIPTPRRLTTSAGGDKSPVFSPDGKSIVYVSYGSDSEGDLYRIVLPKPKDIAAGVKPVPQKLTDISTADKDPAFAPGGKIIFTAADKKTGKEDLWSLDPTPLERDKKTHDGGSQATVSPRGEGVVYVTRRADGNGALARVNLMTKEITRLTQGEYSDLFPCFINERKIVFVRYADDTNHDGVIGLDDNPSLWAMDVLAPEKPPFPITSGEGYDLFPSMAGDFIYYSSKRRDSVDIYRLPKDAANPTLSGDPAKDLLWAASVKAIHADRPAMALMALRMAYSSGQTGGAEPALAEILYKTASEIRENQSPQAAVKPFTRTLSLYPKVKPWAGLAAVDRAVVMGAVTPPKQLIEKLREMEKEYKDTPEAAGRARIEIATALASDGASGEAVKILRKVAEDYGGFRGVSAEASYRVNEIYLHTGDRVKVREALLDVIRSFPDQKRWSSKAIGRLLDLAVVDNDPRASAANLHTIAEKQPDLPKLAARAMNRAGDIFREDNELAKARDTYSLTVSRFPGEVEEKSEAMFKIAEIYAEQEEFAKALEIYGFMERDTGARREASQKSREGYALQAVRKGERELENAEPRIALKTFLSLAGREPSSVEAHRGVIRARVTVNEADKAVRDYEALLKSDPGNDVYAYALGLALTYVDKPPFARSEALIKSAIAVNERDPWRRQTLGWIYDNRETLAKDGVNAELAMQEYAYAYALTDAEAYPARAADLLLNMGNVNYALNNCAEALENYNAREKLGGSAKKGEAESVYHQRKGECEFRAGEDGKAVDSFQKAVSLTKPDEGLRRVELYERMGLAHQSAGKWRSAADSFTESLRLRRALGVKGAEVPALRNIANNLYNLSQTPEGTGPETLGEALKLYKESESALLKPREPKKEETKKGGGALFNVEMQTGPQGVRGASRGFSETDEKKLIYHHIGKIYGEMGNYRAAVDYFEKKVALTPPLLPLLGNAPALTEKSVALNQLAYYLARLGDTEGAAKKYLESLSLCLQIESVNGLLVNADSLARLAVSRNLSGMDEIIKRGDEALAFALEKKADGVLFGAALNHYARIHYERFLAFSAQPAASDPSLTIKSLRSAASDFGKTERYYKAALDIFRKNFGEKGSATGYFDTALGLAEALHAVGGDTESLAVLNEAESVAGSIFAHDALWKIKLAKQINATGGAPDFEQAAAILNGLPFGTDISDGSKTTLALVRGMYDSMAHERAAGGDMAELTALEKGLVHTGRLSLYGFLKSGVSIGEIAGMEKLAALVEDREQMALGFAAEYAVGARDEVSLVSRKERHDEWLKEYGTALGGLRKLNPTLWAAVSGGETDFSAVISSLEENEAALYIWRSAHGARLFALKRGGLVSILAGDGNGKLNGALGDPVFDGVRRIYHVTEKPFSDTFTDTLAEKFSVAAVPSFASVPLFKNARNISGGALLVAGAAPDMLKSAAPIFTEARMVAGEALARELSRKGVQDGVAVFGKKPKVMPDDPLRLEMDVDGATVFLPQFARGGVERTLLITRPVDAGGETDWEPGAAYGVALAGFSSWVTMPADGDGFTRQAGELLKNSAKNPLDEALKTISDGKGKPAVARIIGSFGFGAEERRAYAKTRFAEKIRSAVDMVRREDWGPASMALRQALAYTSAADVSKYDETLLDKLAEAEFKTGDFEQSLTHQERLNGIFRGRGDKLALADSLLLAGVIQTRQGKHEAAVASMNEALDIYREKGLLGKMAAVSSQLGVAEEGFANYGRALDAYGTALSMQRRTGDAVNTARELRRMGRIYHLRLNQFAKARAVYGEALSVFREVGDKRGALLTLVDMGSVETDVGDLAVAEEIFRSAMAEAETLKDENALALVEFHIANLHWFRGEYEPAIAHARKALKTAESLKDDGQSAIILNTIGLIYWTLNDHQKATDSLGKSLALAKKAGLRLDEASANNNIGLVARSAGRVDESIERFKTALAIDKELKSDWARAYDLRNLSISLLMKGEMAEAGSAAVESLALAEKIGDRINAAKAQLQMAEILVAKGDAARALDEFKRAEALASSAGTPETLWRAARGMGRAKKVLNDRAGAIESYKKAVDIVETMRASIKAGELKSGFLDDKQDIYEEMILLLLDAKDVEGAFAYAERARSRSFIDLLGASTLRPSDEASRKAYEEVKRLRNRREEITRAGGQAGEKMAGELKKSDEQIAAAIDHLRQTAPELLSFVTVEPADINRALAALGGDTVLLEYVVTAKEIVIFALGGEKVEAVRVPWDRKELEKLVLEYRKLIQDGAPLGDRPKTLSSALIEPVKKWIGAGSALGIAPHGVLHYLSFAPLPVDNETLLEKKAIFYIPSVSVFEHTAKRRLPAGSARLKALAVGDPDLGGLAMSLPLSELEAKSLKWVFPESEILTGAAATKKRVVQDAGRFQIVHIASHGQFDPADPLMSGLSLAPSEGTDGVLRAKEVFAMTLSADLVTLSACQTGLGKVTKGDEIIGLNRAFLHSGAHSLLSTLWRVDDMASAVLVKHFYRGLESSSKAEALRKAQLIVKRRFPHPAYWAGFTLVGDYR